jgi:phosphoribosylformylglycinamidine synthase
MTLAAIDECVRNLVCVGADPARIALLDNFGWPGCEDPHRLGELVRAAEACYDGAMAYRAPFISGKDSLNNQFTADDGTTIEIPPTLLISGIGVVEDVSRCVTMDAKAPGNRLVVIGGLTTGRIGGSHFETVFGAEGDRRMPLVDLSQGPAIAAAVHAAITSGLVQSAHDCSEGGLLVAAAEIAIAGGLGLDLDALEAKLPTGAASSLAACCFSEEPSRYLLEVEPEKLDPLLAHFGGLPCAAVGRFNDSGRLTMAGGELDASIDELRSAWLATLDW